MGGLLERPERQEELSRDVPVPEPVPVDPQIRINRLARAYISEAFKTSLPEYLKERANAEHLKDEVEKQVLKILKSKKARKKYKAAQNRTVGMKRSATDQIHTTPWIRIRTQ
jgi:hypothetical protein